MIGHFAFTTVHHSTNPAYLRAFLQDCTITYCHNRCGLQRLQSGGIGFFARLTPKCLEGAFSEPCPKEVLESLSRKFRELAHTGDTLRFCGEYAVFVTNH